MIVFTGPVPFMYIALYDGNVTSHLYIMLCVQQREAIKCGNKDQGNSVN